MRRRLAACLSLLTLALYGQAVGQPGPRLAVVIHTLLGDSQFHRPECSVVANRPVVELTAAKAGDRVAIHPVDAGGLLPCAVCQPLQDPELAPPSFWRGGMLLQAGRLRAEPTATGSPLATLSRGATYRRLRVEGAWQYVEIIDRDDVRAEKKRGWLADAVPRHYIFVDFLAEAERAGSILAARWPAAMTTAALEKTPVIGMTEAQLMATLGAPSETSTDDGPLGFIEVLRYGGTRQVVMRNGRVSSIQTSSR